jgi:hypothetical protein
VDGAPTEEPRPDASNARSQRPATRAIGVSRAFACVLNTRGCPQVFYTALVIWSSALCGCINVPGKQVNAVWGRCPTACAMYVKKEEAWSVLGALRQNLSRLRVEKLGCAGSRPWHTLAATSPGLYSPRAGTPAENKYRNGRGERPRVRSGCPSDGIATRSDVRKSFGSPQS